MLLLLGALSLYSCQDPSRGTGIVTIDPDGGDGGDDVRIPDYPDDYSEIASWGDRGKLNLANVHDPVAAYCDGRYYVITTGMGIMSSDDLEHWRFEGRVLEQTPQWALDKGFSGMPWAPDVQYYNGQYYVYYSYSLFGRNVSAIGVATNRTLDPRSPEYRWTDHGMIVESIPGRDEWNAIDANVIVDEDGTGWLCFGSFWRGIKMFRLDGSLLRIAEPQEWYPLCRRPEGTAKAVSGTDDGIAHDPRGKDFDPGDGAVEAPFIFRHDGWPRVEL